MLTWEIWQQVYLAGGVLIGIWAFCVSWNDKNFSHGFITDKCPVWFFVFTMAVFYPLIIPVAFIATAWNNLR